MQKYALANRKQLRIQLRISKFPSRCKGKYLKLSYVVTIYSTFLNLIQQNNREYLTQLLQSSSQSLFFVLARSRCSAGINI